jgi:hypothetical protein
MAARSRRVDSVAKQRAVSEAVKSVKYCAQKCGDECVEAEWRGEVTPCCNHGTAGC